MRSESQDIYVVGCGPSLKGFDWSSLKYKTTIAINGAVRDVPRPDYFLTADSGIAIKAVQNNFWNVGTHTTKVLVMAPSHKRYFRVKPYVQAYDQIIVPFSYDGEIGLTEKEFCTGRNSGFCGMQFAVILKAKRIRLLGIDLHVNGGEHYQENYTPLCVSRLDEFYKNFVRAIDLLKRHKIEVISHSASSRLNNVIFYEEFCE